MDRNFPEPEVTWVDVVLSCFNLKRVLNIAEDGRRKVKTRARLCNLRMLVWVYLRLLLFPTLWLPSVTYSVGGSVAVSLVLAYGALTGIIMAADLILFGWYLQFNVVVFVLLRFVPGCAIFAINFVMAFFAAFVLVRSLVESRNFDYRDLMAVAFYVGGLLLDILAYKIMKPIILHYSAWDNAVFDHKNELLIQYRGNLKKLETSYARKPDSVSDEVISVNTHDITRLRFRVVVRKLFIKYVVRTLWSENLESEKRACSLDIRIRKLCSVFNTELLSENWSRCWICMVEALECLVLRAGASPQWMMSHGLVANVRWYNKLESQWAPTEELFSYYLKNLCFLCPASEMPSACEKVTFYCRYLDDEVKNMIILLEKLFEDQPDSLDTVKFMVGLNTSKQQRRLRRNTIPLICDAGLSLYRECLAKGESELADSWLALRFAERVELADLACLMKSTMEAVGMCGPRIQLNGNHEGVMKNYEVPVVNLKCSLQHRAKASWMQSSTSPKEYLVSKHADPGSIVAERTSVDSTATTKVATSNSHDWFMNLSPEEQAEYSKQHCIVANRNAAELLVESTRLSDDEMSKFPFTLVPLEDQDETIVLKWTVGGAERERKTNMKKNVPYHCLSLNYNNTISRQFLWTKLLKLGFSAKLVKMLMSIYSNVKLVLNDAISYGDEPHVDLTHNDVTDDNYEAIKSSIGLKQGCPLSPIMFSCFCNDIIEALNEGLSPEERIDPSALMFADDMIIMSESAEVLKKLIKNLEQYTTHWGLTVNLGKTQIILFRKPNKVLPEHVFMFNGQPIDQVSNYKYLGVNFHFTGKWDDQTRDAKTKGLQSYNIEYLAWTEDFGVNTNLPFTVFR